MPTDDNALVFQHSVEQVMAIVYLVAQPGGFFPEGGSSFFGPQPDSYQCQPR
jgi:hypothetical protein